MTPIMGRHLGAELSADVTTGAIWSMEGCVGVASRAPDKGLML